jgi:hypothetical protein
MAIIVYPVDAIATVPTYTGRMAREAHSVFMAGATASDPFGVRSGVRPGTSPTTVTATSTAWTIGAHAGALDMETAVEASGYEYSVNATGGLPTGTVNTADATRPRVDIVWVRLDDPAESDGSAVPAVVAGYTAGAPLASPVAPATPARCMVLATIQVPLSGGGSPTVIWVAPYTVAGGGVLPVPAGVRPANPYLGQYVDDAAAGLLRYNGTAWKTVNVDRRLTGYLFGAPWDGVSQVIEQEGTAVVTTTASGAFNYNLPVAFPNGMISALILPGDDAMSIGYLVPRIPYMGLGNINALAYTTAGALIITGTIRINYRVVGW